MALKINEFVADVEQEMTRKSFSPERIIMLQNIIKEAKEGNFDDFGETMTSSKIHLFQRLRRALIPMIAQKIYSGEYDET